MFGSLRKKAATRPVAVLTGGLLAASALLGSTTSVAASAPAPHWGNYEWSAGQEKANVRAFWLIDRTGDPTMNAIINYVATAWNLARAEYPELPYTAVHVDNANVGKCFVNQTVGWSIASACKIPGLSQFGIKGISATQGSPHFTGGAFAVSDGLSVEEAFTVVCHNFGRLMGLPVSSDTESCMHPASAPGVAKWYTQGDTDAVLALYDHDDGRPPVAVADTYTTDEDAPLTVPAGVLANDTDPDGDTLTATKVTDPAHGTVTLNANGSFTYTPTANYNGSDSFTYKAVANGTSSNVVTVTITIAPVADAPVAVADTHTTDEDTVLTVAATGVLANDTDADGSTLTAAKVTNPAHGTVTLNANGSFVYTPTANYNGPDSFTYKANDGTADSNVATVTITVTAVNDAPVAVADSYTTAEDVALVVAAPGLLANDTDGDSATLTAAKVSDPAHGTVTLASNGGFTYTPTTDFTGTDSFTYKANDGTADSNVATATITVGAAAGTALTGKP
jgi:VCBS repeat-containing protein